MKIPFHPTKTKRASFFAHREYLFLHFSTNQITVTHRKRSLLLLLLLLLLYHHYHSHSLSLPRVYRHSILSSLPPKCCCCLRNFHNRSSGAHTFTDVQCWASHCSPRDVMSKRELSRMKSPPVPLATLIGRELRNDKVEKPFVKYGQAGLAKKGEDYFLIKTDCHRVPGDPSTVFSVFAIFDGHNGISAAIFAKENLLTNVLSAIPQGISRDAWLQALPRALVVGFVKTDTELQQKGETSGTTATFVVVDGWTVTVASVGDSRCILDTQGGVVSLLTVDHRLEENAEERERVTASGGEVGRLNIFGGNEVGPLRCWPGGLCLSRSIGDTDVGEFIVPIPHVKQVKLSNAGGRLIIASDGIWDALSSDTAAKSCRGLPAELAAKLVVKEALRSRGLKDDTTCLVVDIIPSDLPVLPPTPRKKHNMLTAFLFGKKSENSANKATSKLSSVGVVEELFEEGSAMLSERLGKDFPFSKNSGIFRCAVCQVDQPPGDGLSVNSGPFFSPASNPWEGPFLCTNCRKKKDAMEGKRPSRPTITA